MSRTNQILGMNSDFRMDIIIAEIYNAASN